MRIHERTREIRVPRVLGVFTAGRIMNTRTARSQLMGGLIWGISSALHEATEIDPRFARTVNRDLQDYLVPVNADIGVVDVVLLPEVDKSSNPAGTKGVGELGNVGTNAAVANAVFHATGVRARLADPAGAALQLARHTLRGLIVFLSFSGSTLPTIASPS